MALPGSSAQEPLSTPYSHLQASPSTITLAPSVAKPNGDSIINIPPPSSSTLLPGPSSSTLLPGPSTSSLYLPTTINNLEIFQTAIGIPVPSASNNNISKKNRGIYKSILQSERFCRRSYHFFEYLISTCLMLQIVFAAILTALGASSANHTIITVFGAVNTALAGIVALMKGQGLPNRLRQDWNGWRDLRDYVEERERDIGVGNPEVDVWAEIKAVGKKYESVRKTAENNRPDNYIPSGGDKPDYTAVQGGEKPKSSNL